MSIRTAKARWEGNLAEGKGNVAFGNGAFDGAYSFQSRFEEGTGTNPEELIAAAHSACFSMAFSAGLAKNGFTPTSVETTAKVSLEKVGEGFTITGITLDTVAHVPGIERAKFDEIAAGAKTGCPISRALSAVPITLNAELK